MDYISLTNDLLFHMVFTRNAEALKGLLSVLLNVPEADIEKVEVLNPMQYSEVSDSKLTVLDLKVHMNNNTYIHVEMQVRKFEYWTNRTLGYACRQIADQIHADFDYGKLEPVIQISIMDYSLFPDHKRFFTDYIPRDEECYPYTDKLQFIVMDLTQISEATEIQKEQGLVEWARAFNAGSWEEVNQIENPGVKEAAKTMQLIMSNPTEREMIRMRQEARRDEVTQIEAARRSEKKSTAKRMKAKGFSVEDIVDITGLSVDTVKAL